jgi:5-methylcytosine-specific restriction protein A
MQLSDLKISHTINNKELTEIFKCGIRGGMRRGRETNSLVLVSDHTRGVYTDTWANDVLHYTGMGLSGDQEINYMQNKTLSQSRTNGVDLYLFEVRKPGQYCFRGQVELIGEPYQASQPDEEHHIRLVWMFPLKLKR